MASIHVEVFGVLGQHLRDDENASTSAQSRGRGGPNTGERPIETFQARNGDGASALRYGGQRVFEVGAEAKPTSDRTQPDNFGSQRQRRQQLGALQRYRLRRHG